MAVVTGGASRTAIAQEGTANATIEGTPVALLGLMTGRLALTEGESRRHRERKWGAPRGGTNCDAFQRGLTQIAAGVSRTSLDPAEPYPSNEP